jgi:hypothetical protein
VKNLKAIGFEILKAGASPLPPPTRISPIFPSKHSSSTGMSSSNS